MRKIELAISPCPNDTFSFYHFIHDVMDNDYAIRPNYFDIEELNRGLIEAKWDIVKASFPAAQKSGKYELMKSGSALGMGVGPIIIYNDPEIMKKKVWRLGIPGENTTAHFLWNYYYSKNAHLHNIEIVKQQLVFHQIMDKLLSGELDAGIVIHEGRFVYRQKGLKLYEDLGEFWEKTARAPVPLGGIFIKKDLPDSLKAGLQSRLQSSVQKAMFEKESNDSAYSDCILPFMKEKAQEQDILVMEKHIDYYVNSETVCLSDWGLMAIDKCAKEMKVIEEGSENG